MMIWIGWQLRVNHQTAANSEEIANVIKIPCEGHVEGEVRVKVGVVGGGYHIAWLFI